jgi:hypothetical protein
MTEGLFFFFQGLEDHKANAILPLNGKCLACFSIPAVEQLFGRPISRITSLPLRVRKKEWLQ